LFENEKHPHASSLARQLSSIIINYHQLSVEFADNLRFPKEFLSFTQLVDLGFYSWSCFFCRIRGEMFQQDLWSRRPRFNLNVYSTYPQKDWTRKSWIWNSDTSTPSSEIGCDYSSTIVCSASLAAAGAMEDEYQRAFQVDLGWLV
jgi:hypothetical protein